MKNRISRTKSIFSTWVWVLWGALFIFSCTDNEWVDALYPESPSGEEATVQLTLRTPQAEVSRVFARTATEVENTISDVRVLVFRRVEGTYTFSYQVTGVSLGDSGTSSFSLRLQTDRTALKLMVLTQATEAFALTSLRAGDTEEEVRRVLTRAFPATGWTGNIPMYGEILLPDGIEATGTTTLAVTVMRSLARVDVRKELAENAPAFVLEELYVFRVNDRIGLVPEVLADPSAPKVSAPTVPEAAGALPGPLYIDIVSSDTPEIAPIYLPEAEAALSPAGRQTEVTTLVIGGRWGGASQAVTYYRADFYPGVSGHPFGQILRNHRYIFNIRSVSAPGWGTPEEAAIHLASAMQVEVCGWEEFSTEFYFGEHRFAISDRELALRYTQGRSSKLLVESTTTYTIQWLDADGQPTGDVVSVDGTTVSNDFFDVTIGSDAGDGEGVSRLYFRTRRHNYSGEERRSVLRITAAGRTIDVVVSQEYPALYRDRVLRVLSVAEVGDLGITGGATAYGQAMRQLLDVQFSPEATIRIGGFLFSRVENTASYMGATTAARLAIMRRMIWGQDIIYLPYNVGVSEAVATLLLEWLDGSPHHVLIVGTDSGGSSPELRKKLEEDGRWQSTAIATVTDNYKRAAASAGTEDFFSGPFGTVAENATFNRLDAYAGYSYDYPRDRITVLITGDKAEYPEYVFFGVNKIRRIIYHGDAQLFMANQMSNNSGEVQSDLDRLMGNTWAWIVEQVIYGAL